MGKIAGLVYSILILMAMAGCAYQPAPPGYYNDDIHHGYPGPGVADPSAI
jgi:hypothetical protein